MPVIGTLAKWLERWKGKVGEGVSGAAPSPSPIFSASNGQPLRLNNLLRSCILPALKAAGIKWHGWHAFRRSLATNLHDLGVDDHTIKAILRHSSVTVTQRSYIKSLPKQSVAAMNTFDSSVAELVHKRDKEEEQEEHPVIN